MPKEILRSGQLNIELDEEEIAVFREIHQQWGLMPGDIVYALIKVQLAEYRETGKLTFAPYHKKKDAEREKQTAESFTRGAARNLAQEEEEKANRGKGTSPGSRR